MTKTKRDNLDKLLNPSTDDINFFDIDQPSMLDMERDTINEICIDEIFPDPDQPRKYINQEKIAKMAETIRTTGLISPIVVRAMDGRYMIVAGERRYHACKKAGIERISCIVKDIPEAEAFKISLIENLQREELDPFDEAAAYLRLKEKYEMTHDDIARLVGKSRTSITKIMAINRLPETIREKCASTHISKEHVKYLASSGIDDEDTLHAMIDEISNNGLTVKGFAQSMKKQNKEKRRGRSRRNPYYRIICNKANLFDRELMKISEKQIAEIPEEEKEGLKKKLTDHAENIKSIIERLDGASLL